MVYRRDVNPPWVQSNLLWLARLVGVKRKSWQKPHQIGNNFRKLHI
jgi:hypothetical protein